MEDVVGATASAEAQVDVWSGVLARMQAQCSGDGDGRSCRRRRRTLFPPYILKSLSEFRYVLRFPSPRYVTTSTTARIRRTTPVSLQ